jgi:hypothetical protein
VVGLLLLGPPFFPIILFLSTTLSTGMTSISCTCNGISILMAFSFLSFFVWVSDPLVPLLLLFQLFCSCPPPCQQGRPASPCTSNGLRLHSLIPILMASSNRVFSENIRQKRLADRWA